MTADDVLSMNAGPLGELQLQVIYLWHEGPGLFLAKSKCGQHYLFYWTANLMAGDYISFLSAKTSLEHAKQLEMGEQDIFNFFMDALERDEALDYIYFDSSAAFPVLPGRDQKVNHEMLGIEFIPDLLPDPGLSLDGNTFDVLVSSPVSAAIP